MRLPTYIRFGLVAFIATIACVGLLFAIPGIGALWILSWLLLMGRSELTKPVARKDWGWTFLLIGFLVAILAMLRFLHLSPAPSRTVRIALTIPMWFLWLWAIYRRWQMEKLAFRSERHE